LRVSLNLKAIKFYFLKLATDFPFIGWNISVRPGYNILFNGIQSFCHSPVILLSKMPSVIPINVILLNVTALFDFEVVVKCFLWNCFKAKQNFTKFTKLVVTAKHQGPGLWKNNRFEMCRLHREDTSLHPNLICVNYEFVMLNGTGPWSLVLYSQHSISFVTYESAQ